MELKSITTYIKSTLCLIPDIDNENILIEDFIDTLSIETELASIRLILCIAIDIKNSVKNTSSKNIEDNTYIKNLRDCILLASKSNINNYSFPHDLPNRWKFAWAQNQVSLQDKTPCIKCNNHVKYCRAYTFKDFMLWIIDINKDQNIGIDKILGDDNNLNMYYERFSNKGYYKNINVNKLGYDRYVFVANKDDIVKIGYSNADKIIDRLGFYIGNIKKEEKYICLEYDSDFVETTWQPDALTGDWGRLNGGKTQNGNDFFLSYQHEDYFGRTFSVSGNKHNLKERVHLPFNKEDTTIYKMHVENLGPMNTNIKIATNKEIIKEALTRYVNS